MINDKLNSINLILASSSPRRKELISALDIPFSISESYEIDESPPSNTPPLKVAEAISLRKAVEYPFVVNNDDLIITADTTVIVDNRIFGKPKSASHAKSMLSELSAKEHYVVTGVTLRSNDKYHSFSDVTRVVMHALSKEEIDYYVERYNPMDKAGAYAIQEWIGYVAIDRIEGSYYNVMGLPVNRLYRELARFINDTID